MNFPSGIPITQVGEAISTETSGQVFSGSSQYSQNGNFGVIVPFPLRISSFT